MTCQDVVRALSYRNTILTRELNAHLKSCPDCRLLGRIAGLGKVVEITVAEPKRRAV